MTSRLLLLRRCLGFPSHRSHSSFHEGRRRRSSTSNVFRSNRAILVLAVLFLSRVFFAGPDVLVLAVLSLSRFLHQISNYMGNAESGGTSYREFSPEYNVPKDMECRSYSGRRHASSIPDNFSSLEQVTTELRNAGLESSNLILGIDFTKSNEWNGRHSFHRKCLHAISKGTLNPYEQAISIIGRTLSPFDEDDLIPCFGFGDASTHDKSVFSFYPDQRSCNGFQEALKRYREIVPSLTLSGPTSFAPLIYASVELVKRSNWQYHVLVLIADGQVGGGTSTIEGQLSPQEQATIDSIVAASYYPLSIIMIGVGDGPWDAMQRFDDCIPNRSFDNFQFVNFTNIMSSNMPMEKKETAFALAALMEIPYQYKAALGIRPVNIGEDYGRYILPPPREVIERDNELRSSPQSSGQPEQVCPICLVNRKDMAFGCGHLTCGSCGKNEALENCPICRAPITTRVRLFIS